MKKRPWLAHYFMAKYLLYYWLQVVGYLCHGLAMPTLVGICLLFMMIRVKK